jgi:hypothetical protein
MTRGLQTLWYQRSLLNPFRYGAFAWMLLSHKLLRWLVFPSLPLGAVGLSLLALGWPWARIGLLGAGILLGLGLLAFRWPGGRPPLPIAVSGFAFMVSVAGLAAWLKALQGEQNRTWEPTRRSSPPPPAPPLHPAGPSS